MLRFAKRRVLPALGRETNPVEAIKHTLEQYGADIAGVLSFQDGEEGPELLPYATLLASRSDNSALVGVYEWQQNPLVFLVDGDQVKSDNELMELRRRLAMRGDTPYLGVVKLGQLTIHRISLDSDKPNKTVIAFPASGRALLPCLSNQRPGVASERRHPRKWISNVILKLLSGSLDDLTQKCGLSEQDAISLVGRALFVRFLGDRELMPESDAQTALLFDDAKRAQTTSDWLDKTFNGDFLPLTPRLFQSASPMVFQVLGNVLRRAPGGQLRLKWEEKWENLDFAHVPVGVLSQAYEQYLRDHSQVLQRKQGSYYTPPAIASLMARGAFSALRRDGVAHTARVLDPAAGAGVFLLTAFRQLVAERWRHDGSRPDTKTLRSILYEQLTGFDIDESALRFAALGLYLMSIELDPTPEPIEKLRFENLRGKVLHRMADDDGAPSLGSLGDRVDTSHVGRYDLVIGNPPWTSGTKLPNWKQVSDQVSRIADARPPQKFRPKLPNEVLDLPFVWRAMEWARAGGQIAFALHARLLFQQGEGMPEARRAIFSRLDVTGIVNGAELRQTKVWPGISAPFCLLFARNQTPAPGAEVRFVSPHLEDSLNNAGGLRVDASNAEAITSEQIVGRPEILKILFRGSQLDLEIYDRMTSQNLKSLADFWPDRAGKSRTKVHFAGNGYQTLKTSSRIRKNGDGKPGVPGLYLWALNELSPEATETVLVDASQLRPFREERIHDPRQIEIFLGPKLVIRKAPPAEAGRIRAAVADVDLVFNESYYGYSAKSYADGSLFVRYLALVAGTKLALWHALVSSGEFGFEREKIEKFVIDRIPVPPFADLSSRDRDQIKVLFNEVVRNDSEAAWEAVDEWAASLYGLRKRDLEVISDTLKYNLPFAKNREFAQTSPTSAEIAVFCEKLSSELSSLAKRRSKEVFAKKLDLPQASPWEVVRLSTEAVSPKAKLGDWPEILKVADQCAATEVICPDVAGHGLWLARLSQARYWSRSQARLVARRIAWEHTAVLFGEAQ